MKISILSTLDVTTISSEKDCRAELEQVVHKPDCFLDHVTAVAASKTVTAELFLDLQVGEGQRKREFMSVFVSV